MGEENKKNNLSAEPKSLIQMFTGDAKFKIPVFQRDYSWKIDNWKEMWNDITGGFKENNKHYLGSIVLVNNSNYKEVIDGQQRLTTLSIIIKAIHWHISELIARGIDVDLNSIRLSKIGMLLFEQDIYNPSNVTNKIKLNNINDDVFSNYIVKDNNIDICTVESKSNQLLLNCYKFFKQRIENECKSQIDDKLDVKKLLDYFKYITENIIVVEIIASDYSNAYVIFETLNDRGLELTVTDLLKNYLFSKVIPDDHDYVNNVWNKIVSKVGEKNITKYIRHYWNCQNKKVTEKELFKVLKNYIEDGIDVKDFLMRLSEVADIYSAISKPNSQIWNSDVELVRYLNEIKLYNVDLCFPVLLATQLFIGKIKLKRKLFKLCSRISFRYIKICNGSAGDLENAYNKLCLRIIEEKDSLDLNAVVSEMKEFIVPKDEFIESFTNKIMKTTSNKRIIYEILRAVEKNYGGDLSEGYSIEHILPESPTEEWEKCFGKETQNYIYRIGNYTLLEKDKNSEIGNENYNVKLPVYKNSKYVMTQNIANVTKWTVEEIEKRQRRMAIIVENVWNLDL